MTDRAEIQRLMLAAADGDRAAVEPLFQMLWPVTVAYATRFLGNPVLAEDCAQESLVKLFGQLDQYDRERDALTWALTLATWQCRSERRKQQRAGARGPDGTVAEPVELVVDDRHRFEERELVRAALDTLDALEPRDREVIAAVVTDDDELRRALAPATFRKRLERALGRLRSTWRSRYGTP